MKIININKKEHKDLFTGSATIELDLGELITILNSLYEYTENNDISMENSPNFFTMYRNLDVVRDILKYGTIDKFTLEMIAEDMGYIKKEQN